MRFAIMIHMNEKLLERISDFREELANDKRVLTLNHLEAKMEQNEEVMALAYQKDIKENTYNDSLRHFGPHSKEAKQAQKGLFEAKTRLDKHPLVRQYLLAYHDVRILYEEINNELFSPFKEHFCEDKK